MSAVPREALAPALLHPSPGWDGLRLVDVPLREEVELVSIDLPADQAEPLFERGVLPGCKLCPVRNSPFGDPIISVDGALLALRRETARCLCVRRAALKAG
jgi:Fe2+ transport system protein FeoA